MTTDNLIDALAILADKIDGISARLAQLASAEVSAAKLNAARTASFQFTAKAAALARDAAYLSARLERRSNRRKPPKACEFDI